MKFLTAAVATLLAFCSSSSVVDADLRFASQPRNRWQIIQPIDTRRPRFNVTSILYMEPSTFGYDNLRIQRDGGAYDQFLRSNIDNEQAKRNFDTEAGVDHMPFRTWEGAALDVDRAVAQTATPGDTRIPMSMPGPAIYLKVGEPYLLPVRWNNPHASEIEVNIWIVDRKYVVPIRKPTCSGEGYQDNVFSITVPTDWRALGTKVPNFGGCNKPGDCVLQLYAHSVESRMYAAGAPVIVMGDVDGPNPNDESQIQPVKPEVGTDLSLLTHDICLSSTDPSANIVSAQPRRARYVSDIYNSAYQNSAYSPYAGQQPEAISRNVQAACIYRMTTGNRGELGRSILNSTVSRFQDDLENKAEQLVQRYEGITNDIINAIGSQMQTQATVLDGRQRTAKCFRCAETGSTDFDRDNTNTYVPSFVIPAELMETAKSKVAPAYSALINDATGVLGIYVAVITDLNAEFKKANAYGLYYLPAFIKDSIATHPDPIQYRKYNPVTGRRDGGVYAATQAKKAQEARQQNMAAQGDVVTGLTATLAGPVPSSASDNTKWPTTGPNGTNSNNIPVAQRDMFGQYDDSSQLLFRRDDTTHAMTSLKNVPIASGATRSAHVTVSSSTFSVAAVIMSVIAAMLSSVARS